MHDGGDGSFDTEDWFTFYGFGTFYLDESLDWHRNRYTDYNVYWLSLGGGSGRRMSVRDVTPDQSAPATIFRDKAFGEQDLSYWGNDPTLVEGDDSFFWGYSVVGGGFAGHQELCRCPHLVSIAAEPHTLARKSKG